MLAPVGTEPTDSQRHLEGELTSRVAAVKGGLISSFSKLSRCGCLKPYILKSKLALYKIAAFYCTHG